MFFGFICTYVCCLKFWSIYPFHLLGTAEALEIPSGKHTKNYGKSPFFMGKLTISMAILTIAMLVITRPGTMTTHPFLSAPWKWRTASTEATSAHLWKIHCWKFGIFLGIFPQISHSPAETHCRLQPKVPWLCPSRLLTHHVHPQTMEDIDGTSPQSLQNSNFLGFHHISSISSSTMFHPVFSETPRDLRGHSRGRLRAGCTPGPFSVQRGWNRAALALQGVAVRGAGPDFEGSVGAWHRWIGDFFLVDFDGELFHFVLGNIFYYMVTWEIQPSFDEWHIDCRYYY